MLGHSDRRAYPHSRHSNSERSARGAEPSDTFLCVLQSQPSGEVNWLWYAGIENGTERVSRRPRWIRRHHRRLLRQDMQEQIAVSMHIENRVQIASAMKKRVRDSSMFAAASSARPRAVRTLASCMSKYSTASSGSRSVWQSVMHTPRTARASCKSPLYNANSACISATNERARGPGGPVAVASFASATSARCRTSDALDTSSLARYALRRSARLYISFLLLVICLLMRTRNYPPKSTGDLWGSARKFAKDGAYVFTTLGYVPTPLFLGHSALTGGPCIA